ncbi:MAG: T9SS type A sorting domain-containing protein [Flavobacteriales bacterium]|nr:T9SS type A sorting domain-containing protein [Flavobacteriales bacterium]
MVRILFSFLLFLSVGLVNAQVIEFKDPKFKEKVLKTAIHDDNGKYISNVDVNGNGEVEFSEAMSVKLLSVQYTDISDISEIRYFVNLDTLYCNNNKLTSLNLSNNKKLKVIRCSKNELVSLDVSNCPLLTKLNCNYNSLSYLNLSNNAELTNLDCSGNKLNSLDVSNTTKIEELSCRNNLLSSLNITNNTNLKYLYCSSNLLNTLDCSSNKNLNSLDCKINPLLSLNLKNGSLETEVDINDIPTLKNICLDRTDNILSIQNEIERLGYNDVSINSWGSYDPSQDIYTFKGMNFHCQDDTKKSIFLKYTISDGTRNGFIMPDSNGNFIVRLNSGNYKITAQLESFSVSPQNVDVSFPNGENLINQDFCLTLDPNVKVIDFVDEKFKRKLVEASTLNSIAKDKDDNNIIIDLNKNGEIEISEALETTVLNISDPRWFVEKEDIIDLSGIEYFKNLTSLFCSNNKIKYLNLSENILLDYLDCGYNELASLNLSKNHKLETLLCSNNMITSLDLSNNSNLKTIMVYSNPPLEFLNIKNGSVQDIWESFAYTNLKHICIDEEDLPSVLRIANRSNSIDWTYNTYCSFVPGGGYNTIKGKNRFCSDNSIAIPHLKYTINDGTTEGLLVSNEKGAYSVPVQTGSFTITPQSDDYTFQPSSVTVKFDELNKEEVHNFCATPVSEKNDVEVVYSSIIPARPGFDAKYKIVYQNKGIITQSGMISLTYFDDVLDYVGASIQPDEFKDYEFVWNYSGLKPFEKREITVEFNVNSPQETPAVNNDDLLNFTASITTSGIDATPSNNTFELRQTVVGSYDPNDKTCLEGTDVLEDMIGEYVHYRIRFENEGTFYAENVVVADEIDESKFDISTLEPIDASHDFETRIKGNKVEFIFEGIKLPTDDANNDGYVIFKIKTLPSLKLGDSFSNQASIYFDFNLPIITNNETTTIVQEHLGVSDFEFNEELTLYPNPIVERLNISSKNQTQINSIEIYNIQGQLILSVPQFTSGSIDISHLPKGMYLVKTKTDKGVATTKVVKE